MALHWNLKACDQSACWNKDKDGDDLMTPLAHGLIWATMVVGLNEITEKNLQEWCWRLNLEISVHGERAMLRKVNGERYNESDLRPFVGLNTNASSRTRKQYLAISIKHLEQDHTRDETARQEKSRAEANDANIAGKGGAA